MVVLDDERKLVHRIQLVMLAIIANGLVRRVNSKGELGGALPVDGCRLTVEISLRRYAVYHSLFHNLIIRPDFT